MPPWGDREKSDRDFIQRSDEELWERDVMLSLIQLELFWGFFSYGDEEVCNVLSSDVF